MREHTAELVERTTRTGCSFENFGLHRLAHPGSVLLLFQEIEKHFLSLVVVLDLRLHLVVGQLLQVFLAEQAAQLLEAVEQLKFADS